MNIEEKARAYDEALERARKIHNEILNNEILGFPEQIREIFPELRESEEVRVIQFLINWINDNGVGTLHYIDISWKEQILSWLEKQKEQKPTDLPAGFYYIDLDGNKYYSKEFRYGDMKVKVGEQKPCECVNVESEYDKGWRDGHKAGLKDAEMQKPAWSEEDERRIDAICELLENTSAIHPNYSHRKLIIWLKSLRPSWKPSEEQMEALIRCIAPLEHKYFCILSELYEQLKKL